MNIWAKIFFIAMFSTLLIPAFYVFDLDSVFNGQLLNGYEYLVYLMFTPFICYPFWKGVHWYKSSQRVLGVFYILSGVIAPVVSGMFGVFIFEVLSRKKSNSKYSGS